MTEWLAAKNVLCIRLDYLGDVLMTTPAFRAIKETLTDCRLTLMTSPGGAAAAEFIPDIDETLAYSAPWLKHGGNADPHEDLDMIEVLRRTRFDAAIIHTVFSQNPLPSALMCYLAGIPLRLAHCRENPYRLLTNWVQDPEPEHMVRHEVQRQLDLVASVGFQAAEHRMRFTVPPEAASSLSRKLLLRGLPDDRPWMLVHPGATAASRRYPPELWARTMRIIASDTPFTFLLTGSRDEIALADSIVELVDAPHARLISLAGELTLGELGALISRAPVLLSNNTGPVHIASAVGTPVVDLYALTNPQHTPWMVSSEVLYHDVPCRFCFKSTCPQGHNDCLTKVDPQQVASAALRLMRQPTVSSFQLQRQRPRGTLPIALEGGTAPG